MWTAVTELSAEFKQGEQRIAILIEEVKALRHSNYVLTNNNSALHNENSQLKAELACSSRTRWEMSTPYASPERAIPRESSIGSASDLYPSSAVPTMEMSLAHIVCRVFRRLQYLLMR